LPGKSFFPKKAANTEKHKIDFITCPQRFSETFGFCLNFLQTTAKMKFPSIHLLYKESTEAAFRFPLSLLSSILATSLSIYLVENEGKEQNLPLLHLLLTFALGISLFFMLDLFSERYRLRMGGRISAWALGILVLGLIYLSFPSDNLPGNTYAPYIRYLVYNLALHLMVAFVPFLQKGNLTDFWNYNKTLFIRVVFTIFFSQVIALGITLALGALNLLFDVKIDPSTYLEVYILTYGIFNTWYFLAGIPKDFQSESSFVSYPKGLKIFTQYILIPLLILYLGILYAYGAKIIFSWDWPRGIVTYLIITISVLGIFTNLLLFPYQKEEENSWIKGFYKLFYYLLLPLTAMLFIAIGIRVEEYGLTVNRYIIVLMGIWLTFISFYFIFGFKSIKTVPISLAIAMILSSFGPWGMFSWSEKNQLNRLGKILTESGILVDGKIKNEVSWKTSGDSELIATSAKELNVLQQEKLREVNSIIQYLENYHGLESLFPWISSETAAYFESRQIIYPEPDQLMVETLGLKYSPSYSGESSSVENTSVYTEFSLEKNRPLEITGYDQLIEFVIFPNYENGQNDEMLEGSGFSFSKPITVDEDLIFTWEEMEINLESAAFIQKLTEKHGSGSQSELAQEELSVLIQQNGLEVKVIYQRIGFTKENDKTANYGMLSGTVLVQKTDPSVP
jgi:hypothetical protein